MDWQAWPMDLRRMAIIQIYYPIKAFHISSKGIPLTGKVVSSSTFLNGGGLQNKKKYENEWHASMQAINNSTSISAWVMVGCSSIFYSQKRVKSKPLEGFPLSLSYWN